MFRVHSISLKLTVALLAVGLFGALLVGFLVSRMTTSAFDRFIFDQGGESLGALLAEYYEQHSSWEGVASVFTAEDGGRPAFGNRNVRVTVADADGWIVHGVNPSVLGTQMSRRDLDKANPLVVGDEVVGYLLYVSFVDSPRPGTPEFEFMSRVQDAVLYSAVGATAIAVLLAVVLGTTLTRPIRALTEAVRVLGEGNLGHQVDIHSPDELGELAESFNRMSARLAETSKLRRQMTADIAHDLRTPLSVLMGYTEALSDAKLKGSPLVFSVMHEEAQHLNHLIDQLRLLSLADAGELPLYPQEVEPETLLRRTAKAHWVQAKEKGIELYVYPDAGLPMVNVDVERMAQVLGNLVSNALRYTPKGGRIALSAESDSERVLLRVSDTGVGIKPEDVSYVFERFYRGEDSRRQQDGESGLGLAIVKSLVEAQGGNVTVESKVGEGTTFTVRLPACSDTAHT